MQVCCSERAPGRPCAVSGASTCRTRSDGTWVRAVWPAGAASTRSENPPRQRDGVAPLPGPGGPSGWGVDSLLCLVSAAFGGGPSKPDPTCTYRSTGRSSGEDKKGWTMPPPRTCDGSGRGWTRGVVPSGGTGCGGHAGPVPPVGTRTREAAPPPAWLCAFGFLGPSHTALRVRTHCQARGRQATAVGGKRGPRLRFTKLPAPRGSARIILAFKINLLCRKAAQNMPQKWILEAPKYCP